MNKIERCTCGGTLKANGKNTIHYLYQCLECKKGWMSLEYIPNADLQETDTLNFFT